MILLKNFILPVAATWTLFLGYIASKVVASGYRFPSPTRTSDNVTLISVAVFVFLAYLRPDFYFPAHFFFFSALVVTMFTDTALLLISQVVTLYLVPVGWMLSNLDLLPLSPLSSIGGSLFGLLLLLLVKKLSLKLLKKEGLGQGDVDLLCFIGAFTGPLGCWVSLLIGSLLASLVGGIYLITSRAKQDTLLPFGLFLSLGAISYVLFQKQLSALFFPL